ncbi:MAG: N-acetylmuramoyl-L-alanine amidase, partial [Verrucomicrobiales bacterium]|nr:N-acetylmuramoyl-L-alanine amidase [Verrucomicrobiales bacterium]
RPNPIVNQWEARMNRGYLGPVTPDQLLAEIHLRRDLIPSGTVGRKYYRPMQPRYVTIHSTQNYSGDAYNHALALKRGALKANRRPGGNRIGYLTWHFTTQDDVAVQHLPCGEQGEHADFDGPGNNYSIGIEMCEHRGNDLALTIDRTARLAAYLCYTYQIPLSHVVPHHHWPRAGVSPAHKDCPHFLLDKGKQAGTWKWFQNRVKFHLERLVPGPAQRLG